MTDISNMTNEQLNEALAIDVMGWHKRVAGGGDLLWVNEKNECTYVMYDTYDDVGWNPSTDLNQAFEVLDKWVTDTGSIVDIKRTNELWGIEVWRESPITAPEAELNGVSSGKFLARAICESVLMAARGEK